ncbi:hypothetical protein PFISCL1PPCAC_4746, partial [Pristionchus fissidentatus]
LVTGTSPGHTMSAAIVSFQLEDRGTPSSEKENKKNRKQEPPASPRKSAGGGSPSKKNANQPSSPAKPSGSPAKKSAKRGKRPLPLGGDASDQPGTSKRAKARDSLLKGKEAVVAAPAAAADEVAAAAADAAVTPAPKKKLGRPPKKTPIVDEAPDSSQVSNGAAASATDVDSAQQLTTPQHKPKPKPRPPKSDSLQIGEKPPGAVEDNKRKLSLTPVKNDAKKPQRKGPREERDFLAVPPELVPVAVYNMLLDRKNTVDLQIDVEVESRRNETLEEGEAQVVRDIQEGKGQDGEWPEDYIIAPMDKNLHKVVTKYSGYARCSITIVPHDYIPVKPQFIEFWIRMDALNKVYSCIVDEMGSSVRAFNKKYPHRFAPKEKGHGINQFITSEITLYKSRLRAFEWRKTREADLVNQPPILFEDWTGEMGDLPEFVYIHSLSPSATVKNALEHCDVYGSIKCKSSSACSKDEVSTCDSALTGRPDKQSKHCGCFLIQKGAACVDKSPFECTKECACDAESCGNRVVQRGRQIPILVFKDFAKGWTTRALTVIKKGEFFGEYVGEVLTAYEAAMRDVHTYMMDMPTPKEKEDAAELKGGAKTHSRLAIDGSKMGNETRFISHSCEPNLKLVPTYVERAGGWYSRMAFVAKKNIAIGEELTFDYFPYLKHENAATNVNDIFESCMCNKSMCKFAAKVSKEIAEKRKAAVDGTTRRERRAEAMAAGDSFADEFRTEASMAEQKAAAAKGRTQRAHKRNGTVSDLEQAMIARATEESKKEHSDSESSSYSDHDYRDKSPEL